MQINAAFRGGLQLDRDVLLSVLEIHQNDVQATIQFLQAGQNDFVEQAPAANGQPVLPPHYMDKPANWVAPKSMQEARDPASIEFRTETMKALLLASEPSFLDHFMRLGAERDLYVAVLLLLVEQGVDLPQPSKAKILAAVWGRKLHSLAAYLLSRNNYVFGLPEVLKVCGGDSAGRCAAAD